MASRKIQMKYDEMKQVQQLFQKEAETIGQMNRMLRSKLDKLQGGDWIGQGANRFYSEMNGDILPALARLERALADAAGTSGKATQTMQNTEQRCNAILKRVGAA